MPRTSMVATALVLFITFSVGSYPMGLQEDDDKKGEVQKLLLVLRNEKIRETQPDQVIAAMERLGSLRAEAAIDDLILLLTFREWFEWESKDTRYIDEIRIITTHFTFFSVGQVAGHHQEAVCHTHTTLFLHP